jgi:1-acyl-sn-glycerol-3-phosphate acyltransferase
MKKIGNLFAFFAYALVYLILGVFLPVIAVMVLLIYALPNGIAVYFLRILMYFLTALVFKVGNHIKVIGRENIPTGVGILYLSNHLTLIDSFLIDYGVTRLFDMFFHQNRIAFNAPDVKNFYFNELVGTFFKTLKTVPVKRDCSTLAKIHEQVDVFSDILKDGNLILFFEGTRSRTGKINDCRIGAALTAVKAKPRAVIPIRLIGLEPIMPIKFGSKIHLKISMGHKGKMIIGKPLVLNGLAEIDPEANILEQAKLLRSKIKESVEVLN